MQYRETATFFAYTTVVKVITGLFLGLIIYLFSFSPVGAKPSYSDTPSFCPIGYGDFLQTTRGGEGRRMCCEAGNEPTLNEFYCQSTSNGATVEGVDARSNVILGGDREICKQGQFLVSKVGFQENYCLDISERVEGGTENGKYFAGCRPNLSPFRLDVYNTDGTTQVGGFALPLFCEGGGGLFVNNQNSCLCGDGTEFPIEDSTPSCSTLCSQRGGVLYDAEEIDSLKNICNGPDCCNNDVECLNCVGEDENSVTGNIYTSLGCINPTRSGIVVWLIRVALILTSAIGVFRFIQASFLIRTGDPEKIKEGQEIVTSAIIALVLVLVSVPLLQFIGVNVLGIFPAGSF